MFGKRFTVMKVAGIPLHIDLSWFLIFFIVAWSLAVGVFPDQLPNAGSGTWWAMGIVAALGLFLSIVLHEFGHAVAARRQGIEINGITLFVFGGVAEMRDDPPNAMAEFIVAIGGPVVTVLLIAVFFSIGLILPDGAASLVIGYLALINAVVLIFNMIPAFPLDGGRVLRAGLWAWKHNLRWATRISARIGVGFSFVLFGLAVVSLIGGNFIGAIWWFFLGMFLQNAARTSYQQVLWKQTLSGVSVERLMRREARTVPADLSISDFVEQYVYRYHHKMFPAVEQEQLLGCVNVEKIRDIPREEWETRRIAEVMEPCSEDNTIADSDSALTALRKMIQHSSSRLIAVRGTQLTGIIAFRDLMSYASRRLEFEDGMAHYPQA